MSKADKKITDESNVNNLDEVTPILEDVKPVIKVEPLLKDDHIGLRKKGESSMVQIHKSMRKHFDNGEWEIIEPTVKKK